MISMSVLRKYWAAMPGRVPGLRGACALSVDANMATKVGAIGEDDTPVLFYLPPTGRGRGYLDASREDTALVLFVMQKYNPRKTTPEAVLEAVQPVAEAIKERLLADAAYACGPVRVNPSTITTVPETEFFNNWAGWTLAFNLLP